MRNTRKTIVESLVLVEEMQALCQENDKELVVYLSMAFGNPYGDPWDTSIVEKWAAEMAKHIERIEEIKKRILICKNQLWHLLLLPVNQLIYRIPFLILFIAKQN